MKPVYQTILTAPGGDCFRACVASILELRLDDVPNIQNSDNHDWWQAWNDWLEPRKIYLCAWAGDWRPKGYSILTVKSKAHAWHHAVVALDSRPIWNPRPGYGNDVRIDEYGAWSEWVTFGVLDPAVLFSQNATLEEDWSE